MTEFFISPESERRIQQERLTRQRRFEQLQTQASEVSGRRLMQADQLNPNASSQLKQAYAITGMTDDEFERLSLREAESTGSFDADEGGIANVIGNAVNAAGMGFYNQLLKPAIRGAFTLVDTAAQELVQRPLTAGMAAATGESDGFAEAWMDYGPSAGAQAIHNVTDDDRTTRFDLGEGFFTGGQIGEQVEQQRTLDIRGEKATFGRAFSNLTAGQMYSPGDAAYDKTAGVAQFVGDVVLDPTAWATMGATKAISASKGLSGARTLGQARRGISISKANEMAGQIERAGLVSTPQRNTALIENAERLFKNPKVLDEIAQSDAYTIMRRMRMDRIGARSDELADFINRLGDARTPTEVAEQLLEGARRGHVRERGFYSGAGRFAPNPKEALRTMRLDKNLPEFRYGGNQPGRVVSAANRMQAATDIDDLLRLGKVGEADRAGIVTRALAAADNTEMMNVVSDGVRAIGRRMDDVGVDPEDVNALIDAHKHSMNEITSYLVNEGGKPSPPPWGGVKRARIRGMEEDIEVPTASMLAHLNRSAIPLPDPTDIRRATTKLAGLRKVYNSVQWKETADLAKAANRYLFKFPTLFTRLAYPIRNNLDNQARAAGAGYHSIMTNPIRWMSLGVRDKDKFRDIVTGENFNDVARQIGTLTDSASGMWQSEGARRLGAYHTFRNGQDRGFTEAWMGELARFANDDIAVKVASQGWGSRDELIDSLINSGNVDNLSRMSDDARAFFRKGGQAPDRAAVDEYVTYIEGHIEQLTNNVPELRTMIASGKLDDLAFNDLTQRPKILRKLREQYQETAAPRFVSGDIGINDGPVTRSGWKKFMGYFPEWMATRPENRFTRYPLLAEVFADDLARLMPSLGDDAMRLQLVERASKAGFDDKLFPQIAQAAQKASGQRGALDNIDDLVDAAKLHSSDRVLDIAFDATQRSSFQEMADVIVPFWDAFTEVATSWGRILRDNPAAFSRGAATMQWARGEGMFYANEHGEEVFSYPGGGMLAKALGIENGSARLEGRVEGLNLVTQGIGPGFGPMVSWASGAFLPDTPDLQWVRDLVSPFGTAIEDPSDLLQPGKVFGELTPAWAEKAINAYSSGDIDPVAFNSAVGDAVKVLGTSGAYDTSDPQAQRQLVDDAEKAGRWVTFLRSALQMAAPTGPGVTWEVRSDPDGQWHRLNTMANAFHEIRQATGDEAAANMAFIDMYGVEPFWITQAKTQQLRPGPRTREGMSWIQRNDEAAERHPDVIGHFVPPEDPTAPPDYGIYQQRLARGDIESLTGEQQLALANKTKARSMYAVIQQRTEDLPYSRRQGILSLARNQLEEQFPGWQADVVGVASRLDRDERIRRLEEAVDDEALSDSPVTDPLRAYLGLRRRVLDQLIAAGGAKTLGAQSNEQYRTFLYDTGVRFMADRPAFQGVWQSVLMSEVQQ